MFYYKIVDTIVAYLPLYERTRKQMEKYRIAPGAEIKPEVTIKFPEGFLKEKEAEYPHLTQEDLEYIYVGSEFYRALIHMGRGFMLHASSIDVDGEGYLFSAPSGTGKSTHTGFWKTVFKERVRYVNDDKPAIREEEGIHYVYGTPFSGKTDLNENIRVPIRGVVVLERESNYIRQLSPKEALYPLLNQIEKPLIDADMYKLLNLLDQLLNKVPVYLLRCTATEEAARMAFRYMKDQKYEKLYEVVKK